MSPSVEDGFEDVRYKARTNGAPALLLAVKKQDGTDTTKVAEDSAPSSRT